MSCKKPKDSCKQTYGPNFELDSNSLKSSDSTEGCVQSAQGTSCLPVTTVDPNCSPFQLVKNNDNCLIESVVNESLNIGGAVFNVYKLLGVHEQCKLVDQVGYGKPLSNGDAPNFPALNAFDLYNTEWRSIQRGGDILTSAFIGYDFGEIQLPDHSRNMYSIDTKIYKNITNIAIKQSAYDKNRVTRARIERSNDGKKWYGVQIIELPNDDCLNTIHLRQSVPSRYWRIRPIQFNGGDHDHWGVQAIQLFDNHETTQENNIQDKIFVENRDREYATEPLMIKGSYDLLDVQSELSKFGIELPSESLYANIGFASCVHILKRPLIIGDIIELPSEAQYNARMERIEKYMEVTDVSWSTEGYTPGWEPTLLRVVLQPAYATQETQDIFGDLAERVDDVGSVDINDGIPNKKYQDYADSAETIKVAANEQVPEHGAEGSSAIREFSEEEILKAQEQNINIEKLGLNSTGLYVEDAMPPNNAPYSEGDTYPDNPNNGDYHRLTYSNLTEKVPARLYRWSAAKNRWIYLETDKREIYNGIKPLLKEFQDPINIRVYGTEITKKQNKYNKCKE